LYHSRDRIVAASPPLHIYTESANPIGAALACLLGFWVVFFCFVLGFLFYKKGSDGLLPIKTTCAKLLYF
jgi:hypothetical protein